MDVNRKEYLKDRILLLTQELNECVVELTSLEGDDEGSDSDIDSSIDKGATEDDMGIDDTLTNLLQ